MSARNAREHVGKLIADWGIHLDGSSRDALDVITSELVGNAVRHATGPVLTFGLHVDTGLRTARAEVLDGSPQMPTKRASRPGEESGRGLVLVEALAVRYGSQRTEHGKRVWAEIGIPTQRLPPTGPSPAPQSL